jgi:hypothetical protein
LQHLDKDLMYFGWCLEDAPPCHGPLCCHAYAVTRAGARVLLANIDTCAYPIDHQIACMVSNGLLSHGRAPDLIKRIDNRSVYNGIFLQRPH